MTITTLPDQEMRDRWVAFTLRENDITELEAELAVDEALDFLRMCTAVPGRHDPGPRADIGWHTMILHTQDYARVCDFIAGRFIHHIPHADRKGSTNGCTTGACTGWAAALPIASTFELDARRPSR